MKKGYSVQWTVYSYKFIFLVWILLLTVVCTLSTTYAQEASPSAEVQAKLDALKQEIASKASALKQEINSQLQNKALIGKVSEKSDTTLKIQTKKGIKEVKLNEFTEYASKVVRVSYNENRLAVGDYIAALGDLDDLGILTAKQLVLLPVPKTTPKIVISGQISAKSDKLVLKNEKGFVLDAISSAPISSSSASESSQSAQPQITSLVVDFDNDTLLQKDEDEITFNQIKTGEDVIVTGILDDEILMAEFIYVVPTPAPTASPSAQPIIKSASPSGQRR